MQLIVELSDEHRELADHAAYLRHVVSAPVPDPAAVAALRWRFVQLLHDHCVREQRQVYQPLMGSGDAVASGIALRCDEDFGQVAQAFRDYVADWPIGRIAHDWAGFGASTRATLGLIAARIEAEERELYPQAQRVLGARRAA